MLVTEAVVAPESRALTRIGGAACILVTRPAIVGVGYVLPVGRFGLIGRRLMSRRDSRAHE